MGSQWLSCPYQQQVREIIRSGKLGKIVSISQSWNFNGPRWHVPKSEDVAAIREKDTDWKRWLLGRASRPFDPRAYFEFRIFKDFSGGITDQWYSHGSGLAHFYLDTFIPDDTVSNGGIFAWHDVRENPDTFQCVSTFGEKQVLYTYSTTFGSGYGDHTIIRGTHGTLYSPGGEGSPQWWFYRGNQSAWGSNVVFDLHSGKAKPEPVTHSRASGNRAGASGRQSESAHRQLVRVHAQSEDPERTYRDGIRARGGGGDGDAQLSRRRRRSTGIGRTNRSWTIPFPRKDKARV